MVCLRASAAELAARAALLLLSASAPHSTRRASLPLRRRGVRHVKPPAARSFAVLG
jgi:hypothetical protein